MTIDHIAELASLAIAADAVNMYDPALIQRVMARHGLSDHDEVRGLPFEILLGAKIDADVLDTQQLGALVPLVNALNLALADEEPCGDAVETYIQLSVGAARRALDVLHALLAAQPVQ